MASSIYQQVLDAVVAERAKQRGMWSPEHDAGHDALQWSGLLMRYQGRAVDAALLGESESYWGNMVKAAAVSLAALESFTTARNAATMVGDESTKTPEQMHEERYGAGPQLE